MSRVIRDVKLLESPFPHGPRREQMHSGCCPLQRSSFKFCKVFINLKVILSNENIIGSISVITDNIMSDSHPGEI